MAGRTIQIFLPDSDPSGVRVAELTTRIIQAVAVPRNQLDRFLIRPESKHIGAYFLFGTPDLDEKPAVYIGQTEEFSMRLRDHDAKKEFWSSAVAVISRTHSFTQAHIRWLEWRALLRAAEAARYEVKNGNAPSEPFVTEPIRADLEEIFETVSLLLDTLGHPLFRPVAAPSNVGASKSNDEFVLNSGEAQAFGLFTSEGFVVRKGSICRSLTGLGKTDSFVVSARERLVVHGVLARTGETLVFTEDHLFARPSPAAVVVLGRRANGWTEWKTKDGRTLDELKRAEVGE